MATLYMIEVGDRFMSEPARSFQDAFNVRKNPHTTGIIRIDDKGKDGLIWDHRVGWIEEEMTGNEKALVSFWTRGRKESKPSIPLTERESLPITTLPAVSRSDMKQDTAFRASRAGLSIKEFRQKQQEPRRQAVSLLKPCPHPDRMVLVRRGKEFDFFHCPVENRLVAVEAE